MSINDRLSNATLEECLEAILTGRITVGECLTLRPDLGSEIARRLPEEALARLSDAEPLPAFRESLRKSVMAEATNLRLATTGKRFGFFRVRAVRVALVAAVLTVLLSGIGLASTSSLPNSPLYPVKLAIERARLALEREPKGRARLHVDYAKKRIEEIKALGVKGDRRAVESTVNRAEDELDEAAALAGKLERKESDEIVAEAEDVEREKRKALGEIEGEKPEVEQDKETGPDDKSEGSKREKEGDGIDSDANRPVAPFGGGSLINNPPADEKIETGSSSTGGAASSTSEDKAEEQREEDD
ncbi:MAG: DUF5667 domain-containing protein [Actinobacteria bacterium]|nr:DUF5667 domain-containing protein [Actinomycetota bacterium]